MGRRAAEIVLNHEERAELQRWRRRRSRRLGLYVRAGIVLDCAAGLPGAEIAERHRTSQQTVTKWRGRSASGRLAGLSDAPRTGQSRRHGDERMQEVLDATLNRRPSNATHWSVRSLSGELGVPRDFVHRVWRAFGLKPHLSHSFKLSTDPHFVAKVRDVVGLYPALPLGESVPMNRKILGHRGVQTTKRYAHIAQHSLKASADRVAVSLAASMEVTPPHPLLYDPSHSTPVDLRASGFE